MTNTPCRAFSVNSIDYILKPVDEERLAEAIARYETIYARMSRPDDYLETILNALQRREKRFRTRFLIAGVDRFHTLQVDSIAYFYSENKVTTAVTFDGRNHVVNLPLSRLEEQLDPDRFFRANRQVLLSVGAIDRLEPYFNGKVSVTVHPRTRRRSPSARSACPSSRPGSTTDGGGLSGSPEPPRRSYPRQGLGNGAANPENANPQASPPACPHGFRRGECGILPFGNKFLYL